MARKKKEQVENNVSEKPKKKKWWLIIIIAIVIIFALFSCGGNDSSETSDTNDNVEVEEKQEEVKEEDNAEVEEETTADTADIKSIQKNLKENYDLKGGSSVRNDATNSWTIETIANANAIDPTVWAEDYVKAYWNKDIKVMWVVNFANNTTTSINTSDGSMIFITQRDYVEDEEHDAKALGAGTILADWVMYHDDNGELVVERTDE